MHKSHPPKSLAHGASHTGPKKKGRGAEDATPAPQRNAAAETKASDPLRGKPINDYPIVKVPAVLTSMKIEYV